MNFDEPSDTEGAAPGRKGPGHRSPESGDGAGGAPREITSADLLGEADRLYIHHQGQCYTLRVTSSRKLILTK